MDPLALSCVAPTFCMTIGWPGKNDGSSPQYSATWNGSSPSKESRIAGALFIADDGVGGLSSISCPSRTFCMAVGTGEEATKSFVWQSGRWRAVPIARPLPIVPAPPPKESETESSGWSSVACLTQDSCIALGAERAIVFLKRSEKVVVATTFDRWNGHAWARIETLQGLYVESLACASSTECLATGSESAVWNGGSWRVVRVPGETTPSAYSAEYRSVWCAPSFTCMAVGTKTATGDQGDGAVAEWSAGRWLTIAPPVVAGGGVGLSGISCWTSTSNCIVTGSLPTSSAPAYAFSYDAGTWTGARLAGTFVLEAGVARTSATTALVVDRPITANETYWISER